MRMILVAAAGLIGAILLALAVLRPFSVVHPTPELRSYGPLPAVLAAPAFYAGPIVPGNVVDQQVRLSERDVAVRLWLGPAREGADALARIELLAGPRGPSLRSGAIDVVDAPRPIVARLLPPLHPSELGGDGLTLLRLAPAEGSQPIRVGMAKGMGYRPGRASIAGELLPEDQQVMFEVARILSPGDVWTQVWSLIESETLPVRAAAAAGPIVLVASLMAGVAARGRRTRTALIVGLASMAAAALIVVDRTSVSLFPGPDFNPTVILR